MTLPVTIPNTFANATTSIPLANLDANFVTIYDTVNGIGNGAETLANVQITGGNATFTTANVTTLDLTNIEVTNIKAKDGTAAIAIANSTGVTTQSTPAIISVNSASDALRITQTGAGNALVVEDSANPDATPFVIDQSGRILIGALTTDGTTFTPNSQLQISAATGTGSTLNMISWSASGSASPSIQINKSNSGAIGSRGIVASGDILGVIQFTGDDGVAFIRGAQIVAAVDGTPGTNDMPGRLVFSTTADGASSPTERMRITNAGNVGIGATTGLDRLTVKQDQNASTRIAINNQDAGSSAEAALRLSASGATWDIGVGSSAKNSNAMTFGLTTSEFMRIDSSGNLLVGTTTAEGRATIRGSTSDATAFTFSTEAQDGTDQLRVRCDGAVYMGLDGSSPYNLTNGAAANAVLLSDGYLYRSTSSLRYKRDIEDLTHGLVKVLELRPVTYKGISPSDGENVYSGFIAEEVHAAGLTEFVQYDNEGQPDALHYGNMVALMAKAIQELKAELDTVKAELATLKGN
jgi:hypothetical protein